MRARSALFTLFGDVVMPTGGEAWLSSITAAMGTLGFSPQAVRTALHRMTTEGWVEPRRVGRYAAYRTTDRGVARLEEAAQRIYRLRSQTWDGRWRMLVSSALEGAGQQVAGHRAAGGREVAAELEWIGFGRLEPGVWVSPHDHRAAVEALLARLDLATPAVAFEAAGTTDDVEVARRAWDLDALRREHEAFLAEWGQVRLPAEPEAAFATRLRLVHRWRKFLFLDPGLPTELLPAEWPGHQGAEVFKAAYEAVLEPSAAWWREAAASTPEAALPGADPVHTAPASPFAPGLAALGHPR